MNRQTGIYTLDDFRERVGQWIGDHAATGYVSVLYNIRGMGNLNDQIGMEAGTRMMYSHAIGLQERIGEKGMVARVAGDMYIAIFTRERQGAVMVYLQQAEVAAEVDGSEVRRYMSTHAGYYQITERCRSAVEMRDILDEALRMARSHADTSLYAFGDDAILEQLSESRRIEGMFRDAITNEEFLVYYQPKVEARRYRMKGAEALCRWIHDGEMILPFRFIPVYERNGDICELDFYMLEHVCRDLRRWLDEGKTVVRTSVNLSREHMGDRHLVEHIVSIIDQHQIPHEYIEIELTETSTEVDYMELREIVNALHALGIHTSIDDFGVGYSSMNLLAELPWNMVKIDKSFVPLGTDEEDDKKKMVMLRSIISMANALELECIAEGVETARQVVLLKEQGCYFIQGYYFDRPLPVADFEERLSELTRLAGA